jgi:ABC-type transport system substrate-binding protein
VVRRQRRGIKLLALILGLSMIAAACGGDDDDDEGSAGAENEGVQGGELVDLGTFVGDPPEHIDPALNVTLDAYQVVNSMYDGLTEIDASDPENVEIVPQVAESYEANDDATVWTFTIRPARSSGRGSGRPSPSSPVTTPT